MPTPNRSLNSLYMRYRYISILLLSLLALPAQTKAAESSSPATATASSGAAYFTTPSTGTPNTTISTSISDQRDASARDTNTRPEEQDQNIQGNPGAVKSSFQIYVENSTGKKLDIYGRDLFRNVPSTFAPLKAVQVNPDYIIGPGDALQIRGWGMVDIDVNVTVSRSGDIYLPRVGSVKVSGVKYRDLQGYLKKAVGKIFKSFELSASIAQTRSCLLYTSPSPRD